MNACKDMTLKLRSTLVTFQMAFNCTGHIIAFSFIIHSNLINNKTIHHNLLSFWIVGNHNIGDYTVNYTKTEMTKLPSAMNEATIYYR